MESGEGTPETVCNPHHGGQTRGPDPLPPAVEGGVVLQLEDGEVVLEQGDADWVAVIVSEERVVSPQPGEGEEIKQSSHSNIEIRHSESNIQS